MRREAEGGVEGVGEIKAFLPSKVKSIKTLLKLY